MSLAFFQKSFFYIYLVRQESKNSPAQIEIFSYCLEFIDVRQKHWRSLVQNTNLTTNVKLLPLVKVFWKTKTLVLRVDVIKSVLQ